MRWRPVTIGILIATAVIWALYDVIPFLDPARGDTISEVILYYALRSLFIPYAFGVLCGHFFFPRDGAEQHPRILVPLSLAVLIYDVVAHVFNVPVMLSLQAYPFVPFLVGIPIGTWLWPQSRSDKLQDVKKEESSDADSGSEGTVR